MLTPKEWIDDYGILGMSYSPGMKIFSMYGGGVCSYKGL